MLYNEIQNKSNLKVFEAPELYQKETNDIFCFLAGGITDCPNWQKDIINIFKFQKLEKPIKESIKNLILFNPRRNNFPIHDPNAANEQISWEFKYLEQMDIFSMYFCNCNSDQPICMYELGRNIAKMQQRFPSDWHNRIVITIEKGYKRQADVEIQTKLATNGAVIAKVFDNHDDAVKSHAYEIYQSYLTLSNKEYL